MKATLAQFWQHFIRVPATPPAHPQRWQRWGVCIGAMLFACIYVSQLWATRAPDAAFFIWPVMETLRYVLLIGFAGWLFLRPGWRAASAAERSRGRMLNIIGVTAIALLIAIALLDQRIRNLQIYAFWFYLVQIWILLTIRWSVVHGFVVQGAALFLCSYMLLILGSTGSGFILFVWTRSFLLALFVLYASLLLNWRIGLIAAAGLPFVMALLQLSGFAPGTVDWFETVVTGMMLLVIACVVALYDTSLQRALATSATHTTELAAAQKAALAQNQQLQTQSAELEAAQAQLHTTIAEQDQQIQSALAQLRQNSVELSTLTTPLSEVAPGVIVAPLVGTWNLQRATSFQETLLHKVEQQRLQAVIFDLHGIRSPDTAFATMLEQTIRALFLLGCRAILVGIQPETAQILVAMETQWQQLSTASTLAAGVQVALRSHPKPGGVTLK